MVHTLYFTLHLSHRSCKTIEQIYASGEKIVQDVTQGLMKLFALLMRKQRYNKNINTY